MVHLDCKEIIIDCDGVLTDGTVFYTHTGERFKGFHTRDIRAIRELIANGFGVTILTASSWPGLESFAERCGADVVVMRDKGQFKSTIPYMCVCDDIADIDLINGAWGCFAPADCDPALHDRNPVRILKAPGGKGVIAELVKIVLSQ